MVHYLAITRHRPVANSFVALKAIVFAVKKILRAAEVTITVITSELARAGPRIDECQTATPALMDYEAVLTDCHLAAVHITTEETFSESDQIAGVPDSPTFYETSIKEASIP